jgi:hypothetical protein
MALALVSCARFGAKRHGEPVVLAGLSLGMSDTQVNDACSKRSTTQLIRRSYGGFDAKGRALASTPGPVAAAPGERWFLAHMTCGSPAGLTDVTFPPDASQAGVVVIRHEDYKPTAQ